LLQCVTSFVVIGAGRGRAEQGERTAIRALPHEDMPLGRARANPELHTDGSAQFSLFLILARCGFCSRVRRKCLPTTANMSSKMMMSSWPWTIFWLRKSLPNRSQSGSAGPLLTPSPLFTIPFCTEIISVASCWVSLSAGGGPKARRCCMGRCSSSFCTARPKGAISTEGNRLICSGSP
jgi:hypothetical protein